MGRRIAFVRHPSRGPPCAVHAFIRNHDPAAHTRFRTRAAGPWVGDSSTASRRSSNVPALPAGQYTISFRSAEHDVTATPVAWRADAATPDRAGLSSRRDPLVVLRSRRQRVGHGAAANPLRQFPVPRSRRVFALAALETDQHRHFWASCVSVSRRVPVVRGRLQTHAADGLMIVGVLFEDHRPAAASSWPFVRLAERARSHGALPVTGSLPPHDLFSADPHDHDPIGERPSRFERQYARIAP